MDQTLLDAFKACRTNPVGADEADVASLVARVLDPALSAGVLQDDLRRLAQACPGGTPPWEYLAGLGFAGNPDDYEALDNSNLARVLSTRRGIPITLGVLLIRVARVAGRQAVGLNFPGHFVVEVDDVLVDPFSMQPLPRERFVERLPAATRQLSDDILFAPASSVAVGLRMLNNVKRIYSRQAVWHLTLDVIEAQLQLAPDQPALHLEHGDVWRRLGLLGPARKSFERALELVSSASSDGAEQVRRGVQARLDELEGSDDVIH